MTDRLIFIADADPGGQRDFISKVKLKALRKGDELKRGFALVTETPKIELEFDKDPKTYLPLKDDMIEATATITPTPPPGSMVRFELTNFTYPPNSETDQLQFADGTVAPKDVAVNGNEAKVNLKSTTYWGVVDVKATFTPLAGIIIDDEEQLPVDSDTDGIADSWELDAANGGTLALGGNDQDQNWDDESTRVNTGNRNDGDGFTKLGEYQGVTIGPMHLRMKPPRKEVFMDIFGAAEGAFAIAEVRQQLDLDVYQFKGTGIGTPGAMVLNYQGVNTQRSNGGKIIVVDDGVPAPSPTSGVQRTLNGIVIQNGVYTANSSRRAPPGRRIRLGRTTGTSSVTGGARARVYDGTIDNIFALSSNNILESARTTFEQTIAEVNADALWTARYRNRDFNNNGSRMDPFNPFDLLSQGGANDAADNISAGFTVGQLLQATTLHEVGHALGMGPNNTHPTRGNSPMRSGWGSGRVFMFSTTDIRQVTLK